MRSPSLCRRSVGFTLVGAVGLGVVFSLAVEGLGESHRTAGDLEPPADGQSAQTQLNVCSAKKQREAGTGGDLELTATKDGVLKFQCGENLELKPEDPKTNVYQYTVTQEAKNCDTKNPVSLTAALEGATVAEDVAQAERAQNKSPVYVFKYTTEPTDEKHLCYTCVTAPQTGGAVARAGEQGAAGEAAPCTVYIKVPKKAGETSDATPGARATPAAIATAVGGFLAVVLRF